MRSSRTYPRSILCAVLVAACVLCYHNSCNCDFVFDDISAIKENRDLRPHTPISNIFFNDFWGTPMHKNMVGVAIGAACRDRCVAFASTFATFFTRAFDQLRMGAISQTNANFAGSHCGVSIGEDGPSQMALEDLAMFRAIPGATVFYPSDAVSMERAVELAANTPGICFIRTTRANTPVLYCNEAPFRVGGACVVRHSPDDRALVVAAGITLVEAIAAHDLLKERHGTRVRVVDPFTVKPLDAAAIAGHAAQCADTIVTVEDHYYEGGLGEAVLAAVADRPFRVKLLAVDAVPRSGKPEELLKAFKIDAAAIVETVLNIIKS